MMTKPIDINHLDHVGKNVPAL